MEIEYNSTIPHSDENIDVLENAATELGGEDVDLESDANVGQAEAKGDGNGEPTKHGPHLSSLEIPLGDDGQDGSPRFVPATPSTIMPSLRGKLIADGELHICRGVWAMSDDALSQPGQTSDFEFKLVKPGENQTGFPRSGKYQGWFVIKQSPPQKPTVKIDEREININFTAVEDGTYEIEGQGSNKFGSYTLQGHLDTDGMMQMYRLYVTRPVSTKKRVTPGFNTTNGVVTEKKKVPEKQPVEAAPTPRESSGRVRKKPNLGTGFEPEFAVPVASSPRPTPTPAVSPRPTASPRPVTVSAAITNTVAASATGRAQRMPAHMQKCSDLLKEIARQPQAIWFAEPVDYVKLNIPDYPTIITNPMDFKTIRLNLEAGLYATPDSFAEHVRLVFRNATQYNQLRDNPVNIAAREMASKFEEKYRIMVSQLGLVTAVSAVEAVKTRPSTASLATGPSGKSKGSYLSKIPPRNPIYGAGGKGRPSLGAGPRIAEAYIAPAMDSSAHHLAQMQRQMQEMQDEIIKLRSAVRQNEIKEEVENRRDAAHNPLTYAEKKALIAEIHLLPGPKMEKVVEIIREAMPTDAKDDSDEIEIPLDELDTLTLRKLQKFIEDNASEKKKRPAMSRQSSSSGGSDEMESKKVKKEKSPRAPKQKALSSAVAASSSSTAVIASSIGEIGHHDEVEGADLLFDCDSFDGLHGLDSIEPGDDAEGAFDSSEFSGQATFIGEMGDHLEDEVQVNTDAWTAGLGVVGRGWGSGGTPKGTTRAGGTESLWSDSSTGISTKGTGEAEIVTMQEKQSSTVVSQAKPQKNSSEVDLKQLREDERRRLENLERTVTLDVREDEEMMQLFGNN